VWPKCQIRLRQGAVLRYCSMAKLEHLGENSPRPGQHLPPQVAVSATHAPLDMNDWMNE
jgi:hypothetical protein